jgi:hypothetical protein
MHRRMQTHDLFGSVVERMRTEPGIGWLPLIETCAHLIRRAGSVSALALLLLLPASPALSVLTFTADSTTSEGSPLDTLRVGELVTIDLTVRSDGEGVLGVGSAATGYDTTVIAFDSGIAVASILSMACVLTYPCVGGLDNSSVAGPLHLNHGPALGPEIQFLNAVSVAGTSHSGEMDRGVTGLVGDPQFQLVFRAMAPGTTTINLGTDFDYGDAVILGGGSSAQEAKTFVTLTVIPEPSIGVLMVLGLAGLARRSRRGDKTTDSSC